MRRPESLARVARAVVAFVVVGGDVARHAEVVCFGVFLQRRLERRAVDGVSLHDFELFVGELTWLEQHAVGNGDLTDVVQRAGEVNQPDEFRGDLAVELGLLHQVGGQGARVIADASRCAPVSGSRDSASLARAKIVRSRVSRFTMRSPARTRAINSSGQNGFVTKSSAPAFSPSTVSLISLRWVTRIA